MPARVLPFVLHGQAGPMRRNVQVDRLVIAGWTGRDKAALEKHIAELEAIGVKRPSSVPIFYRASAARLTTDDSIEVLGDASSGEAEFVLLRHADRLWVGTGSDHTDREVENYGVSVSKQMCDKPLAPAFWDYEEIAPHWDRLVLRAYIPEGGGRSLYQEGTGERDARPGGADGAIRRQGRPRRGHRHVLRHAGGARRHPALGGLRVRA